VNRVQVSDNAVLHWLERVEGVDVRGIRRRIADAARNAADKGASGVRVAGVTFNLRYGDGLPPVVVNTHTKRARPHLAQPRVAPSIELDE
jgi:hypothetical protein